jgi:hypothetical protein
MTDTGESRSFMDQALQTVGASKKRKGRWRYLVQEFEQESKLWRQDARRWQEQAERLYEECKLEEKKMAEWKKEHEEENRLRLQLEFDALCLALRRNDPNTRMWNGGISPPAYSTLQGYARPLGEALRGNTHVSALYVDLSKLLLSSNHDHHRREALAYVEPLVDFVSKGTALQRVNIVNGDAELGGWYDHLSAAFVNAIGNSSSIAELTLLGQFPCGAFRDMMALTMSLKKLELWGSESGIRYTAKNLADFVNAFQHNQSLEQLHLMSSCGSILVSRILRSLWGHVTLTELELWGTGVTTMGHWNDFCRYLCSTQVLCHLKLVRFNFSAEKMRLFLHCLIQQDDTDATCAPITKLSLETCDLDDEAMAFFADFMHTKVESKHSPALLCPLRELCLGDWRGSAGLRGWTGPMGVSLLLPIEPNEMQSGAGQQTIGSQLSSLSVDASLSGGFLKALAKKAHVIHLDALRIVGLNVERSKTLKKCVLQLRSF